MPGSARPFSQTSAPIASAEAARLDITPTPGVLADDDRVWRLRRSPPHACRRITVSPVIGSTLGPRVTSVSAACIEPWQTLLVLASVRTGPWWAQLDADTGRGIGEDDGTSAARPDRHLGRHPANHVSRLRTSLDGDEPAVARRSHRDRSPPGRNREPAGRPLPGARPVPRRPAGCPGLLLDGDGYVDVATSLTSTPAGWASVAAP